MRATMLAKGLLSWIPGVQRAFFDRTAAGGTASAPYCYGVWVKHLSLLSAHGMAEPPRSLLELGPGASLGTGIAGLLSGAERYIGVDAVAHMRPAANLEVFHGLVQMFRNRAPRPVAGFPPFDHLLDRNLFPSAVLDDARLAACLAPERLDRIEGALKSLGRGEPTEMLRYHADGTLPDEAVDLVMSHVTLNHVADLDRMYARCARWVRPGGWMSHQVDFSSLGTAPEWNGHRGYGEIEWKVISGRRPYFVNREPPATHIALLEEKGFDVVAVIRAHRTTGGIRRDQLAPRWRGISDDDFNTLTAFFIARRRAS